MNDYTIRKCAMSTDELKSIDEIERNCEQGTGLQYYFAAKSFEQPRALKFSDSVILVTEHTKTQSIVGTVTAGIRSAKFGEGYEKIGWICSLRVMRDHRGCGLAKQMVAKLEDILRREMNCFFVYAGLSTDNTPSIILFEQKLGYQRCYSEYWLTINVNESTRALYHNKNIETVKLDQLETEKFLISHFSDSFMFPKDISEIRCNVFIANMNNGEFLAVNVHHSNSIIGIAGLPDSDSDSSVELNKPLSYVGAFPFVLTAKAPQSTVALFKALMGAIIADFLENDPGFADVLFTAVDRGSNLPKEHMDAIKSSQSFLFDWGDHYCCKSLLDDDQAAAKMVQTAKDAKFWFLDGRDL